MLAAREEGWPRGTRRRAEQHRLDFHHLGHFRRHRVPGLIATLSTTYNEPYYIAERFASLDHISNGRAGWNIITTANDDAAYNFGQKSHMEKTLRYERAKEFVDICTALWDSWDDDALVADKARGLFYRTRRAFIRSSIVAASSPLQWGGALQLPRPPQGYRPVLIQVQVARLPVPNSQRWWVKRSLLRRRSWTRHGHSAMR